MAVSSKEKRYGELVPVGGGDPIPLLKTKLVVGRRENCDVVLRFSNISSQHCELSLESGYWFVQDLNSRNGTRVNGYRVNRRRIDPGDQLHVGKHVYEMKYSPAELGASGPPPDGGDLEDILSRSLMESAGLNRRTRQEQDGRVGRRPRPAAASPAAAVPATTSPAPAPATPSVADAPAARPAAAADAASFAPGAAESETLGNAPPIRENNAAALAAEELVAEEAAPEHDADAVDEYRLAPD